MNERRWPIELDELILRKLEGTITPAEYEQLVQWLDHEPEAACYYIDFTMLYVGLSQPGKISFSGEPEDVSLECYNSLFNLLAENEKGAPKIEKPDSTPIVSGSKDVRNRRLFGQVTPLNLWMAAGSIAALLMMIAYATFYPRVAPSSVAVLTDSIQATWGESGALQAGQRLYDDGRRISLLSGCAKIIFDYGFVFQAEDGIRFRIRWLEFRRVLFRSFRH